MSCTVSRLKSRRDYRTAIASRSQVVWTVAGDHEIRPDGVAVAPPGAPYLLGKFALADKGLPFKRRGRSDVGDGVPRTRNMLCYSRAEDDIELGIGRGKVGTPFQQPRLMPVPCFGNRQLLSVDVGHPHVRGAPLAGMPRIRMLNFMSMIALAPLNFVSEPPGASESGERSAQWIARRPGSTAGQSRRRRAVPAALRTAYESDRRWRGALSAHADAGRCA
jgi:hypothetical protein